MSDLQINGLGESEMKKINENAADRYSYIGEIYTIGEKRRKREILKGFSKEWKDLYEKGYIHIHDLDAYGLTYNCLTFDLLRDFPFEKFSKYSSSRKIVAYYDYLKTLFADMGNEQSGGMALANYDNDTAYIFNKLDVDVVQNEDLIRTCTADFIEWCNHTHTRMGQTSYYVTLNIGLAKTEEAKKIALILLDEFEKGGDTIYKPNIVFKVSSGVNSDKNSKNYDLFVKSLLCTAKKMIPTYLLCDSDCNKDINAEKLAIMGCRTRVVANMFGDDSSIGRGNIDNISINLPRIAMETVDENPDKETDALIKIFSDKWDKIASVTKDILLDRFYKVCSRTLYDFPINKTHRLWMKDFRNLKEVFKNGTLSLGFIGLSEAMEVLTGKLFYNDANVYLSALGFLKHMRCYCDFLRQEYNLNFSLLATSGELISGKFANIDKDYYGNKYKIFDKGFYTNSFHINVDSDIPAYRKIQLEGMFHGLCNGGCITYVELKEAPIGNDEGLKELIDIAVESGISYLGFNFPKDICNQCGTVGVFDTCTICGSNNIKRIRRVSGYLEILDGFTTGKKNEVKQRKEN